MNVVHRACLLFLANYLLQNSQAHLCAKIHRRGSISEPTNLIIGENGFASGTFNRTQIGFLLPEPNCKLRVGNGLILFGFERSDPMKNAFDMGNTIGKDIDEELRICCTCAALSCEMVKLGNSCARIFRSDHCDLCSDPGYNVNDGDSEPHLKYGTPNSLDPERFMGEGILSSVVNWGCKLVMFEKPNYGGTWRVYYNGVDARFGNGIGWVNPVGSYTCECQRPPQQLAEWITIYTRGQNDTTASGSQITSTILLGPWQNTTNGGTEIPANKTSALQDILLGHSQGQTRANRREIPVNSASGLQLQPTNAI